MKELNDLLEALERWYIEGNQYEAEKYLRAEYRAYKAATPPLVLEYIHYDDVKVGQCFLGWCNQMYMTFGKSKNRIQNEQEGKCYTLPEKEQ